MLSFVKAMVFGLLLASTGCATRYLPRPAVPSRSVPELSADLPTPASGQGQVTFDAVGGSARVEEVTGRMLPLAFMFPTRSSFGMMNSGEMLRPVCVTPCVLHMSVGPHEMRFTALHDPERHSSGFVQVGVHPVIFRHALGAQRNHWGPRIGGILAVALGASAMLFGGAMWGFGSLATSRDGSASPGREGLEQAGLGTIVGGGLTTLTGVLLLILGRPVEQPGTSLQWRTDGL